MKPSKIFVFYVVLFLLAVSVFSQTAPDPGKPDYDEINRVKRVKLIKTDILKEIQLLSKKDQANFYVSFADQLWKTDQTEAKRSLTKGVEIGISPSIEFKNDGEKLSYYWSLLRKVLEKDQASENKLWSKIDAIRIDESDPEALTEANKTYLSIAENRVNKDGGEKSAFDYAVLALRGKNPQISRYSLPGFFAKLQAKNANLADLYFSKIIEALKINEDKQLDNYFYAYFISTTAAKKPRFVAQYGTISDSQRKEFLEYKLLAIQKTSQELAQKKRNDCGDITSGKLLLGSYKQLLPEKVSIVENALVVCQNSDVPAWRKPDFIKKPIKTSQDYLNLAKEVGDKKFLVNYLSSAAQLARQEKNYQLSIEILNNIEKEFRDSNWSYQKIETARLLMEESLKDKDYAAIKKIPEISPEYRPFIIIDFLYRNSFLLRDETKDFTLDLLNQAQTDLINYADQSPEIPTDRFRNPTLFSRLTRHYVSLKLYDQAIGAHGESIKILNKYLSKSGGSNIYAADTSYSRFTNSFPPADTDFINKYFDRIYANIGNIQRPQTRISERMNFLESISKESPKNLPLYSIPGIPNAKK